MRAFTPRTAAVLRACLEFEEKCKRLPSSTELVRLTGIKNRGHVVASLKRLEARGMLVRPAHDWSEGHSTPQAKWEAALAAPAKPLRRSLVRRYAPASSAAKAGHTAYPERVKLALKTALQPGRNNPKIGAWVIKGRWAGMPIFTLTLEERATCPRSCKVWDECYGNHMPFATRYEPGPELLQAIMRDLIRHYDPEVGLVLRLHILGDFYSEQYVEFWGQMLEAFPRLHIFGFTAHKPESRIGALILAMNGHNVDRCYVRFSGAEGPWTAHVVNHRDGGITEGVICPEQTGETQDCGTCGLCWTMKAPIHFLQH